MYIQKSERVKPHCCNNELVHSSQEPMQPASHHYSLTCTSSLVNQHNHSQRLVSTPHHHMSHQQATCGCKGQQMTSLQQSIGMFCSRAKRRMFKYNTHWLKGCSGRAPWLKRVAPRGEWPTGRATCKHQVVGLMLHGQETTSPATPTGGHQSTQESRTEAENSYKTKVGVGDTKPDTPRYTNTKNPAALQPAKLRRIQLNQGNKQTSRAGAVVILRSRPVWAGADRTSCSALLGP